jgi:hypothetical protein
MKWHVYNQSLVRRGELLLAFDVIDNWDVELKEMNKDKIGEPFHYPNTFLLLLGYAKVYFHLPYIQTKGITQGHAKGKVPSIPHYTTINRRINRLNIKVEDTVTEEFINDNSIIIAIDSTGIKVTNRSQWLRDKWNIRKGYLKIHVAVDVKTKKIISLKVTDEHVHDGKVLHRLVEDITKSKHVIVGKAFADRAYDSNDAFRCLADNGILPFIKVRKNAKVKKTNNIFTNLSVISQRKNNLQGWKDSVSYGQRWIAETVFSCIKGTFGEYVYSIKFKNMVKEMMLKASLYNKMISI